MAQGNQLEFLMVPNSQYQLGNVTVYYAGGTTEAPIYTDPDLQQANAAANPYTLDANGTAQLYVASGVYKVLVKNSAGTTIYTRDELVYGLGNAPWVDSSQYASLNAAITAIGSTETTLKVTSDIAMTGNVTVPTTCSLSVENKAIIDCAGYTLTLAGPFIAERCQCFDVSDAGGMVVFNQNSVASLFPEWWVDDGTNIQIALDSAKNSTVGTVSLADKTYNVINAPLRIGSNCSIIGCGIRLSIINLLIGGTVDTNYLRAVITNADYPYIEGQTNNQSVRLVDCHAMDSNINITLQGFSINGNRASFAGTWGISFWSVTDVVINNVEVYGTSSQGIVITGATRPSVTNCIVHDITADGIHFQDVFDGVISGCRVYEIGDYGIEVGSGYLRGNDSISTGFTTVSNNTVYKCNNYGIALRGLTGGVSDTDGDPYNPNNKPLIQTAIVGNTIRDCTGGGGNSGGVQSAIGLQEIIYGCVVSSNTIYNSGAYGVLCTGYGTTICTISNNIISKSGISGIYSADGSLEPIITGNQISESAAEGIKGTFAYGVISNNVFIGNNTGQTQGLALMNFLNSNYMKIAHNVFKLAAGDTYTTALWSRTNSGQFSFIDNSLPSTIAITPSTLGTGDYVLDSYAAAGNGFGTGYVAGAGTPVGSVTPKFWGQEYFDTTNGDWYKAYTDTNTGWRKLN